MTTDLQVLAWTLVLAVVQIFLPAAARTRQYGVKWNASARDADMPPPSPLAGRLARAQANLFEGLPFFYAAVLYALYAGAQPERLAGLMGAWVALRVLYVLAYVLGRGTVRSIIWGAALAVNLAILWA